MPKTPTKCRICSDPVYRFGGGLCWDCFADAIKHEDSRIRARGVDVDFVDGVKKWTADPPRPAAPCGLNTEDHFALANDPPKPNKRPKAFEPNKQTQRPLFTGLDCLPDQTNLFETDEVT